MAAVSVSLTLATKNAFGACAANLNPAGQTALIYTANPPLGDALAEYLRQTIPARCIPFSPEGMQSPYSNDLTGASGLCLVLLQPLEGQPLFKPAVLRQPNIRQIIILQASWLGRKVLPEWQLPLGRQPVTLARLHTTVTRESGWPCRETVVGSLAGLGWGYLTGRMLALNRPDLADRCGARMRRELFPSAARSDLVYISLLAFAAI